MRIIVLFLLAAWASPVLAQSSTPPLSRWNVGLKLGTGAHSFSTQFADFVPPWSMFTGGVSVGRRLGLPGAGSPSLQLDALVERRGNRSWQSREAHNTHLFLPLYLRTGRPAARVHVVVGAGPSFALTNLKAPSDNVEFARVRPVEATALLGLEIRLLPLGCTETTLAFNYRQGLTPAEVESGIQLLGVGNDYTYYSAWLGATLNVYLHPAAGQ